MTINRLVEKLERIKDKYGDMPVLFYETTENKEVDINDVVYLRECLEHCHSSARIFLTSPED